MKRRRFVGAMGAIIALPLIPGCTGRRITYRYRLTVDVDTPDGVRSGASVIEVTTRWDDGLAHATGVRSQVRGQAVVVDLPGGPLFALLTSPALGSDAAKNYAREALGFTGGQSNADTYYATIGEMLATEEARALPRSQYPMLVRFGDIDDPTSVERVDPDNLAASFGPGTSLRAITVEITDDAVTAGIEERLVWVGQIQEMNLSRESFPSDIPVGDFSGMFARRR
ncbi:hypothetical protein [Parasphingopyxis sp.]|uniref:hypothetical protein n=1 Tax=Parasphingopyxis sp. TaxID=1920299 RepID=UPI003FA0C66D